MNGVRDGTVAPFGESFPTKPFPDTTYTLTGAFVQTKIETGAVSGIPGLRFERYELQPSNAGQSSASGSECYGAASFRWEVAGSGQTLAKHANERPLAGPADKVGIGRGAVPHVLAPAVILQLVLKGPESICRQTHNLGLVSGSAGCRPRSYVQH